MQIIINFQELEKQYIYSPYSMSVHVSMYDVTYSSNINQSLDASFFNHHFRPNHMTESHSPSKSKMIHAGKY